MTRVAAVARAERIVRGLGGVALSEHPGLLAVWVDDIVERATRRDERTLARD
jgi:hypothetical protein